MGRRYPAEGAVDAAAQGLTIRLLGAFAILRGCAPLSGPWRTEKARALVKLLALAPDHALHRDQVLEWLWPERDPAVSANNLHYALHAARRILDGPERQGTASSLALRDGVVRLAPAGGVATDVATFEAAARVALGSGDPARHEGALALYSGELLPEDAYADWAIGRRELLRETHVRLSLGLADLRAQRGDWRAAIGLLEQVVAADATREEAHVGLMRAFAASGQRLQALRQYATLREVLRRELDVEPDASTQALYAAILAGRYPDAGTAPVAAPVSPGNLPASLTRFIGREREIASVGQLLSPGAEGTGARLVTLTGSGGCGKTRLALETARGLATEYPDGVWLVELATLTDPDLVAATIARALGVREAPGQSVAEALVAHLRPKRPLLLLDNCEHLLDACARLAARLLAACPQLRLLATSREALQVPGEVVWRVPSLDLPPDPEDLARGTARRDDLLGNESARLLLDRIALRRPDFAPADEDALALAAICRRLDGIPLALELAAARVGHLALAEVAARLDDMLGLLTTGGRTVLPRHRTLRAVLEWSDDLLDPDERTLLHRLAIFAGGCTLEAAETVCADSAVPADAVLDLLARLVDKSLVQVEEASGRVYYRLHEMLRQFARERLVASDEAAALATRHCAHYLALAELADPKLFGPAQLEWLGRLTRDYQNIRAALAHATASGDADAALRLGNALLFYWYITWKLEEGGAWLLGALALPGAQAPSPARAQALFGVGFLSWQLGDHGRMGEYLDAALPLARAVGARRVIAWSLVFLGYRSLEARALAEGRDRADEALAIFRETGEAAGLGAALQLVANVARLTGDQATAAARYEERLRLDRANRYRFGIALAAHNLGFVRLRQGQVAAAAALFRESHELGLAIQKQATTVEFLEAVAAVACVRGEPALAARFYGTAQAWNDQYGRGERDAVDRFEHDYYLGQVQASLNDATFAAAWSAGQVLPFADAIAEARSCLSSLADTGQPTPRP